MNQHRARRAAHLRGTPRVYSPGATPSAKRYGPGICGFAHRELDDVLHSQRVILTTVTGHQASSPGQSADIQ